MKNNYSAATIQRAKAEYEASVKERPIYHDGSQRKTWEQLSPICQWSWLKAVPAE